MSGTQALSSGPFSDAEKADIRRFCGYPAYGSSTTAFTGYRYFTAYGAMEFALNNLAAAEYQVVRGYLASLYLLESAIPTAAAGVDLGSAGPYTRNPQEMSERRYAFRDWRMKLVDFLGTSPGPALARTAGTSIVI